MPIVSVLPTLFDYLLFTQLSLWHRACGTGGMLTVAEERLAELAGEHGKEVSIHLYGQEINPETYAITKADLLLKGEGGEAENMKYGSTLSADAFPSQEFDFMLSNPPYGKSWKSDLDRMGGKSELRDPRFIIQHAGEAEFSLITRSSDGQLLFLVNKLRKMKQSSPLGSRIAEVHNGSSLFTGDAGQGESNIRRWIFENDWLEAIIAMPLNMFYNTGIATYIWLLTNHKPVHRLGKVQLIDATTWFKPLRKNLGKKNCELTDADKSRVLATFLAFEETEQSKILPNEAFGYWNVTVERPLRLKVDLDNKVLAPFRQVCQEMGDTQLAHLIDDIASMLGLGPHLNFNDFLTALESEANAQSIKLTPKRMKLMQSALAEKDENAQPVIKKVHKLGKAEVDPLHGHYVVSYDGNPCVVEYEPDTELRDTEKVPMLEQGGIEAFFFREISPHIPDAWVDDAATKIGYEISFTRYFYKPQLLRRLEDIRADIEALEREAVGLLEQILITTEA